MVLEEEVYVEQLSSIIERDYFPAVKHLRQQNEDDEGEDDCEPPDMGLNKFVHKFTSEDNASFEEMVQDIQAQQQKKQPWIFRDETEGQRQQEEQLTLPTIEEQVAIEDNRPKAAITWPFKNFNPLMFQPEGAELTPAEEAVMTIKPTVVKENTRFQGNPFEGYSGRKASFVKAKGQEGKLGVDGKALEIPTFNGYSLVPMTPEVAVGEDAVISTSSTEDTPQFRLPQVPAREALGHCLAERVAQRSREKKRKAMKELTKPTKTPGASSPFDVLTRMSPAAQRLATTKLGITPSRDVKLQQSYTPVTPSSSIRSLKTPSFFTPKSIKRKE